MKAANAVEQVVLYGKVHYLLNRGFFLHSGGKVVFDAADERRVVIQRLTLLKKFLAMPFVNVYYRRRPLEPAGTVRHFERIGKTQLRNVVQLLAADVYNYKPR